MDAVIVTIGDEILVGQTVDTNSAHIAKELYALGIKIVEICSISDTEAHITSALDKYLNTTDLIIMTGGLGPTNDDITKSVLTNYFKDELVLYPEILDRIKTYFDRFNKPFLPVNRQQAMLPKNATIIENDLGTASGMWFKDKRSHVLSMPGVPYEMKGLLAKFIERAQAQLNTGDLYHSTAQVIGIGESFLAEKLTDWEQKNRENGITVSYLPSVGTLKLRLTGTLGKRDLIDENMQELRNNYAKYVLGGENDTIEVVVGDYLREHGKTIGTVESCTGGSLATKIVSVPGSSDYYWGSIVSYTNELKANLVGVDANSIEKYGAVSQTVVEQMAANGRKMLGTDYCISVSGIAGPGGGSEEKPVGTVWIGVATPENVYAKKFSFGHNRERNIKSTVLAGLNMLRLIVTNQFESTK